MVLPQLELSCFRAALLSAQAEADGASDVGFGSEPCVLSVTKCLTSSCNPLKYTVITNVSADVQARTFSETERPPFVCEGVFRSVRRPLGPKAPA